MTSGPFFAAAGPRAARLGAVLCALALLAGGCATQRAAARPRFWTGFQDHPGPYSDKGLALRSRGFVGPPPAAGSPEESLDLETFRRTRALEGSPRWRQAAADDEIATPEAPFRAFACALGARIAPEQAPTLTRLLGRVLGEVQLVQNDLKSGPKRPRPFVVAEPAPICIRAEPWLARSSSYPSGHAATGWAWALILARLAPEGREAILARGLDYGESRVICGVHYRSDVEAGRIIGAAVAADLQQRPAFVHDLAAARAELARARAASAAPSGCAGEG